MGGSGESGGGKMETTVLEQQLKKKKKEFRGKIVLKTLYCENKTKRLDALF